MEEKLSCILREIMMGNERKGVGIRLSELQATLNSHVLEEAACTSTSVGPPPPFFRSRTERGRVAQRPGRGGKRNITGQGR